MFGTYRDLRGNRTTLDSDIYIYIYIYIYIKFTNFTDFVSIESLI